MAEVDATVEVATTEDVTVEAAAEMTTAAKDAHKQTLSIKHYAISILNYAFCIMNYYNA